ncbi:hypothetical protein LJR289_002066 [Pseudoduganella sp. LjRoot289]|uniref:hypothetical protein n=1 Tax=Pseudoduganella sp. LjRoot289 TaxID=3342314 RepID=UPI003ECF26A6
MMNDQSNEQFSTGSIVAQGWILMCLILVAMLATQFMNEVICAQGSEGGGVRLKVMAALLVLHAFVPMLIYTFSARWFRWAIAGLTLLLGALIVHAFYSVIVSPVAFDILHLLDFAHHGLAIWVGCLAFRWAREAGRSDNRPVIPGASTC